jgi:hypothetical protein
MTPAPPKQPRHYCPRCGQRHLDAALTDEDLCDRCLYLQSLELERTRPHRRDED